MKWALVGKPDHKHVLREIRDLHEHLASNDQEVVAETVVAETLGLEGVNLANLDADVFIAVGGDGTVLLTLSYTDKPVLGVNAGGVGFLSEVEPKYARHAVDRILGGKYEVEQRHKLACKIDGRRVQDAANEATVQTARIAKLIKYRVEIDGEVGETVRGDGVIISTPTGSTGYSLSVGGPILHPSVSANVISPIAAFRLGSRPLVVPADATIRVTLLERKSYRDEEWAKLVVDGQHSYGMKANSVVELTQSKQKARFIRFNGGFYHRVRTKLAR